MVAMFPVVHKKDLVYLEVNLDTCIAVIISLRLLFCWFVLVLPKGLSNFLCFGSEETYSLSLLSFVPS